MAEPAASTTTGIALAFGTVSISGAFLGIQYETLLAGFFGGLVSLSVLPPMSNLKTVWSVVGSAFLAGYFAPICATWALVGAPWLVPLADLVRLACAVVIGICWQPILPVCIDRFRSWIGTKGGQG